MQPANVGMCVCVITEFSLGVNNTSVIESNVQFSLSAIFSMLLFWPSTTAAVTTVLPAPQLVKC